MILTLRGTSDEEGRTPVKKKKLKQRLSDTGGRPPQPMGAADDRAEHELATRTASRAATLDHRYEYDVPDRAERWLQAVERRQRERRTLTASSSCVARRTGR
jgi:hypothetical protein